MRECILRGAMLLAAGLTVSAGVQASAELAQAKACLGCHHVSDKRVGPSFQAVAARYAGVAGAETHLANKIVQGGRGVWGVVVMPANPRITPQEARQLAAWVLRQK